MVFTGVDGAVRAADVVSAWLRSLASTVDHPSPEAFGELLAEDVTWRDFLAVGWGFSSAVGRTAVAERLVAAGFSQIRVRPDRQPEFVEGGAVWVFIEFAGPHGPSSGFVSLVPGELGRWQAAAILVQLEEVEGHPRRSGARRPVGKEHTYVPDRPRWKDERASRQAFEDADPRVVVIGAGQCGLAVAARLGELEVPTLVLERTPRVGDVWRNRYASLALHNPLNMDHLPYLPFPATWPSHTPKDRLADFFESYAGFLDINVWTGAQVERIEHDGDSAWTITVSRADGSERELHPGHVVVATGLNGEPAWPVLPGIDEFGGTVTHSDSFAGGEAWRGKRAVVIGAGVSGHEIAMDLAEHGADVTLVQRSSTYVVNAATYGRLGLGLYAEGGLPVDLADAVANSTPTVVAERLQKQLTAACVEADKALLDALEARGFRLDHGPDGRGVIGAHFSGRDGYHINIGAAEMIVGGQIGLKAGVSVDHLEPGRVVFTDGSSLEAELLVAATGYQPIEHSLRALLGPAAAKVGKVYGMAADGEFSETWRRSGQEGLWFATGFLATARYYSRFLALQIKAIEAGAMPYRPAAGSEG